MKYDLKLAIPQSFHYLLSISGKIPCLLFFNYDLLFYFKYYIDCSLKNKFNYSNWWVHKSWDEGRRSGVKDVAEIRAWAGPRTRHCQKKIRDMSSSYFLFFG